MVVVVALYRSCIGRSESSLTRVALGLGEYDRLCIDGVYQYLTSWYDVHCIASINPLLPLMQPSPLEQQRPQPLLCCIAFNTAQDFVRQLLAAEPTQRPSATQALTHSWFQV
jgi:serine/threonine protein kinase